MCVLSCLGVCAFFVGCLHGGVFFAGPWRAFVLVYMWGVALFFSVGVWRFLLFRHPSHAPAQTEEQKKGPRPNGKPCQNRRKNATAQTTKKNSLRSTRKLHFQQICAGAPRQSLIKRKCEDAPHESSKNSLWRIVTTLNHRNKNEK